MAIRDLDRRLRNLDYEPFIVAHLVKFERPQSVAQYGGKVQESKHLLLHYRWTF